MDLDEMTEYYSSTNNSFSTFTVKLCCHWPLHKRIFISSKAPSKTHQDQERSRLL